MAGQFSFDESPTGDVWLDGKPIMRRVVNVDNLPNNATKTVSHGIPDLDSMIRVWGWARSTSQWIPLPNPENDPYAVSLSITDTGHIRITTHTNFAKYHGLVILEYTKL